MKRSITIIILATICQTLFGQGVVEHCTAWSTSESQTQSHTSKVKVELQRGFSVSGGTNSKFVFGYDEHIICPLNGNHIIDPNNPNEFKHDTGLPVGAIAGSAGVSPTGSATYTIPIFVSPGINGMEPQISVNYNSHGGNGILGIGWSLGGLSAISLSPNLAYNDGFFEAIKFDGSTPKDRYLERYALDGNRLVVQSDNSYRTEIETFQKIDKVDGGFKSTTKEGMIIHYGRSANSRIMLNSSKILSWLIDKIEDANGNYMEYEYQDKTGEKLIKSIKYTGNGSLAPFNSIEFYYGGRTDKSSSYVSGVKFNQTVVLEKIKSFCEGDLVKEYLFKYVVDNKIITRLAKIEEKSGSGTKLNSTNISWGAKGITTPLSSLVSNEYFITEHVTPKINEHSTPHRHNKEQTMVYYLSGDFNGDGFLDFCYIYNFRLEAGPIAHLRKYYSYCGTFINDGNGGFLGPYTQELSHPNYSEPNWYTACSGDFNYDGKTELTIINSYNTQTFRMTWNNISKTWDKNKIVPAKSDPTNDNYYAGNFTGDGKTQQLHILKAKTGLVGYIEFIEIKNGSGTTEYHTSKRVQSPNKDLYYYRPIMTDFDGDGITDFIDIIDKDGLYGVFEYNPNETTENIQLIYEIPEDIIKVTGNNKFRVGDFNGDGKTDLIVKNKNDKKTWQIYFSTGKEFVFGGAIVADNEKDITVCDINGDGKDDIILQPNNNKIVLYLSQGDGTFYSETIPITNYNSAYEDNYSFGFGDFNNDGVNGILFGMEEPNIIYRYKNDLTKQVVSITDGMKCETKFEYSPLNKVSSEKANIAGDIYPLMGPMKVVTKLTEPTGLTPGNNTTITTYKYDKGKIHITGKGFLGFETITAKNEKANIQMITFNELNLNKYVISNTTIDTKTFDGRTAIAKQKTEFLVKQMTTSNANYLAILPRKTIANDYLLHTDNFTETSYSYFDENQTNGTFYGNPSTVTTNNSGIYSQKTTYFDYSASGSWCPSKPKNIQTTRTQDGTAGTKTTIVYDGKGRIQTSITNDYQESGEKPLTTRFTYDNFGNVLTTSASGIYNEQNQTHTRTNSFQYEHTKGRFLIKTTDAAGLEAVYQYDPKYGNKTWEKDPLGNNVFYEYNNFGILTKIKTPLGNSSISRSWEASVIANNAFTETVTTEGKPTTQTWYDILGREVKSKITLYNKDSYTTTEYNNDGTVKQTSLPYFNSVTNWKRYAYDDFKRPKTITVLGLTTSILYLNGSVKTTYPDGNIETKTHNKAGQTTSVVSNNGTVVYAYNAFGNPKTITAADIVTTMEYDKYGNQTKLIDANAGTINYRYNAFGELTYQQDAKNNIFTLIYNNKGQLTHKNCNNAQFSTVYTYYINGMLQKETLGNGHSKEYFYNAKGQLTKLDEKIDGDTYTHEYTYDNRGNVLTYKYPSGYTITNEYDTHGYKTGVKEGNTYIWRLQGSDYINEMGQIKEYLLGPNNLKTKWEYDGNFNLTGINTKTANNATLFDYGYLFDQPTGNLIWRQDNTRSMGEDFSYDNMNRLDTIKRYITLTHVTNYHPNGNIAFKHQAGTYAYTGNKPHAVTEITDHVGNSLINSEAQYSPAYNPFQKTSIINEGNYLYTLAYGTDQQRKKTVLQNGFSTTETRIYSGRYEKETTLAGTKEFHYIPTPSGTVAVNIRIGGSGTTYFLLKDHLGSIMKIVTASGTTIEERSFDAWGNHRNPADWGLSTFSSPLGINRGYTEHEMLP
ncbi:MAG: FG-GAP-like repeat-containing protein, partial [Bacteroidales bacterium]|nr:FG-GAP-like repeat-containing protein [Bacteroidales bacterium]